MTSMCSGQVSTELWVVAASVHTVAVVVVVVVVVVVAGSAGPAPCPPASVVLSPRVSVVRVPRSAGEETP